MSDEDRWGVFANELKIFADGAPGSDWWTLYLSQQPGERLTYLAQTPSGGHVHVACSSEDDAEILLATITDHGISHKHVKVATLAACERAALNSYNQPAPLDAPAVALITALRAAPEGDVLRPREGDAWRIARNAPMDVLLRAADLLRIPYLDYYSQIALADEVTRAARRPMTAAAPPAASTPADPAQPSASATPAPRAARTSPQHSRRASGR